MISPAASTASSAPQREDHTFDDLSLPSCHPSDEWGEKILPMEVKAEKIEELLEEKRDDHVVHCLDKDSEIIGDKSVCSKPDNKSYLSNSSFAEYLSHIIPGRFTNGCASATDTRTDTRPGDATKIESRTERSSHSRCYIENTESIRDRTHDREKQVHEFNNDVREDGGNYDAVYSVEEFTQISEITMDIPTVIAESKFVACSGLPTIEEARRFDPTIAACTADFSRRNGRAHCGAAGANDNAQNGSSKDVIDFVFELVEETFCVPLNRSKTEKKKASIEAYREETVKFSRTNSIVEPWQSSSKHSRSNRTARRSGKSSKLSALANHDCGVETPSNPPPSCHKKEDGTFSVIDAPPYSLHADPERTGTMDEDQTLDWSKIMSFAEKQLESDEKSVLSKAELSKIKRENRRSLLPPTKPEICPPQSAGQDKSTASSLSNSSSTHATAADIVKTTENVEEMRDFSVMDSSSFEEEPRRLLLTSLLFRLLLQLLPRVKNNLKQARTTKSDPESSSTVSHLECTVENALHKPFRIASFFMIFMIWPAGVSRKRVEYQSIPRKIQKPSLLKLVFETDEPEVC